MKAIQILRKQKDVALVRANEVSKSSNFWTNLISIILGYLVYIGIDVDPELPGQIVDKVQGQDFVGLILILLNFVNPIIKIFDPIKLKEQFWAFLKSQNFYVNVLTFLAGILVSLGAILPEGFVPELVEAIQSADVGIIITAVVVNIINPLYYILFDKKK